MPEKSTSPSLEDLLGGMDISSSSSTPSSQAPESSSSNEISDSESPVTSLDDLLGKSEDISKNNQTEEISEKGRLSRKNNKTENKEDTSNDHGMSFDDLLNDSPNTHTASIHIQDAHKKEDESEQSSSNIFHKNFKENASDDSELLINIENYQGEELTLDNEGEEEGEQEEDPFIVLKRKEEEIFQKKEKKIKKFLILAQSSIVFGLLALLISFLIFSFLLDTPTKGTFGNFTKNNKGIELEELIEKIKTMKEKERETKKDIKKSEKIIDGFKNNSVLEAIIEDRINWLEIISQIDIVKNEAKVISFGTISDKNSENNISNPFTFENYTTKGGMENGKIEIIISGKASDSQGYIFLKVSQLIETFNDSKFFSGASIRQYSKTQDSRVGFYMPFTIKLIYHKNGKMPEEEETKK